MRPWRRADNQRARRERAGFPLGQARRAPGPALACPTLPTLAGEEEGAVAGRVEAEQAGSLRLAPEPGLVPQIAVGQHRRASVIDGVARAVRRRRAFRGEDEADPVELTLLGRLRLEPAEDVTPDGRVGPGAADVAGRHLETRRSENRGLRIAKRSAGSTNLGRKRREARRVLAPDACAEIDDAPALTGPPDVGLILLVAGWRA